MLLLQSLSNVSYGLGVALHSLKRIAQSMESTGNESSEAIIASTALPSCFRVTICVRGLSAILTSALAQQPACILQSGENLRSDG